MIDMLFLVVGNQGRVDFDVENMVYHYARFIFSDGLPCE